jgi:hypothetical protein
MLSKEFLVDDLNDILSSPIDLRLLLLLLGDEVTANKLLLLLLLLLLLSEDVLAGLVLRLLRRLFVGAETTSDEDEHILR